MEYEIYCDESNPDLFTTQAKTECKYLLIGGLKLEKDHKDKVVEKIKHLQLKHNVHSEIKWNKVSSNKLDFYKELISMFFSIKTDLAFRSIAVNHDILNFEKYHQNDKELGFYKFYYQMLHHWISDFNDYSIFLDIKTNRKKNRLQHLCKCLQNANMFSSINNVQALPSKEVKLIQLADLLLGLTGARLNNSYTKGSSKHKLILHLEELLGHKIRHTPRAEKKYNVFIINLEMNK